MRQFLAPPFILRRANEMLALWIFLAMVLLGACLIFPALIAGARADDLAGER